MASLAPPPRAVISAILPRPALERCAPHDHLCLIYDTREEQVAASVPFMRLGLERGEKCIYVADENTPAEILEAMRADGIDTAAALASGALTILTRREAYLKNGSFDPIWMINFLRSQIEAAEALGYTSFRVTGETTWALRAPASLDPLIEYECRLNDFFPRHNLVALCQYNRRRFRPETLLHVLHTHPFVVHGGLVCDNPNYIPPESMHAQERDPAAQVQRLLDSIVQNARLRRQLAGESEQSNRLAAESDRWRRLYEGVLANTPDLGYIFDLNHRFTYANHATLATLGRTWDDTIGKNCLELGYEPWHASMHDREIEQVIATRRPIRGEIPFTGAIGRRVYEYIFFPVLGPGGEVQAVAGSTRDITDRTLIEEALRQSEERFRTIVDTTPECVKVVAADGSLLHMNASGLAMIGAEAPAEVIGKSIYDVIAPEHRDAFRAFNERVCRGEKDSLQFDIVGLHGVRRHMESHSSPMRAPNGDTVQLALTRDISVHKRASDLLSEQMRLLELIATGASLPECLTALTASIARLYPRAGAAVLLANPSGTAVDRIYSAGIPESFCQGLIGTPISDSAVGTCGAAMFQGGSIPCADIANDTHWAKPWRDLCVAHGVLAGFSTPVLTSDKTCVASLFLSFGEAHEPDEWECGIARVGAHLAGMAIERAHAAETLQGTEERLRTDLEDTLRLQSVSAAIIGAQDTGVLYEKVLDSAIAFMGADFGSLQMFYPERGSAGELRLLAFRGFTPQAAGFWEWVRPASGSTCGVALAHGKRVVVPDVAQCSWMNGTEDLSTYLQTGIRAVQSTPLVSRSGELLGMISTHWHKPHQPSERDFRMLDIVARQAADLIERKLAEDRQRQAENALRKTEKFAAAGRMAATVAHEINNPLEAVTNLSYLLAQEDLPPSAREYLQILQVELDRISHITRQTLAFYREGKSAVPFDLAGPIDAAVTLFSRKAEKQGASIQAITGPSAPAYGFPGELRQVFANLISNALEAGATTIKIRISPNRASSSSPGRTGRGLYVLVADNGSGISPESARKLFQPFFTTKEEKGTGLGLWVSKGIMQKHEGSIRVRTSTQPGRCGTTFRLFLPAFEGRPN